MKYAVSDIHGRYDLFSALLEKLDLKEDDILYVLGDMADRGPDGIKVILETMKNERIKALMGNHEDFLTGIFDTSVKESDRNVDFIMWTEYNGGNETYRKLSELTGEEMGAVLDYLNELPLFERVSAGGKKFFLSHTVPDKETFLDPEEMTEYDLIWGSPEYDLVYRDDLHIVTGHTPTQVIDEKATGIWKGNNHIAIDCGACFTGRLGCICLDTMEEIYVEDKTPEIG